MFKSLKKWMTIPLTVYPFVSISNAGDKSYGTPISILCYMERKYTEILDREGTATLSSATLYVNTVIHEDDELLVEGRRVPVKAVSNFYDGNTGLSDIMVVYV